MAQRQEGRDRLDRLHRLERLHSRGALADERAGKALRAGQPGGRGGGAGGRLRRSDRRSQGEWGPNQHGKATAHVENPTEDWFQEVQIRLRIPCSRAASAATRSSSAASRASSATPRSSAGMEPIGDWTSLQRRQGPEYGVEDGDVIEATIEGNVIKGYINGVEKISTTDDTLRFGAPGRRFQLRRGRHLRRPRPLLVRGRHLRRLTILLAGGSRGGPPATRRMSPVGAPSFGEAPNLPELRQAPGRSSMSATGSNPVTSTRTP